MKKPNFISRIFNRVQPVHRAMQPSLCSAIFHVFAKVALAANFARTNEIPAAVIKSHPETHNVKKLAKTAPVAAFGVVAPVSRPQ